MISVIVPIYNIEKYLEECLCSLLHQSFKDIEIILVDDGSTDFSGIICENYSRIYENITVIHKKNEGLVSARKTGLQAAVGNIIAYVDGDDWIEPNMIERLYKTLNRLR